MYTYCTVQFVDDGTEMDVIIKSDCEVDRNDEEIFFYGLSGARLRSALRKGTVLEGEWRVVDIIGTFDRLL